MSDTGIENKLTEYEALTPAMRQVVDALAEGVEPSPAALAALSPQEVQEVQLLSRTARLTYLGLHQPPVAAEVEAAALNRARNALAQRPVTPATTRTPGRGGLMDLLRRLRGGQRHQEDDEEKHHD